MNLFTWRMCAEGIASPLLGSTPAGLPALLARVDTGAATSLDELTRSLPGGAYTTLRTFHGRQVLQLEAHFTRLEQTAEMVGKPIRLDRLTVRRAMQMALLLAQRWSLQGLSNQLDSAHLGFDQTREQPTSSGEPSGSEVTDRDLVVSAENLQRLEGPSDAPRPDFRLRLTLDLTDQPGDLYLSLQALTTPPDSAYQQGVPVITYQMQRWLPKAKLTRFIERSGAVRQSLPPGVNEALMFDEAGQLLEGLSSNFFAIIEGEIWTAEAGVLSGITRSLVLEGARQLGLTLHLQSACLSDVPRLQEAFITSSSRAVLPISRIDDHPLPSAPGPLTGRLMGMYERLEERLEKLI